MVEVLLDALGDGLGIGYDSLPQLLTAVPSVLLPDSSSTSP